MKVGIVTVPFITVDKHLERAIETYSSIKTSENELYKIAIVNKYRNDKDLETILSLNDDMYLSPDNCLSLAWNFGIHKCIENGCDIIIVPNLDIVLEPNTIDLLVKFGAVEANKDVVVWSPRQYKPDEQRPTVTEGEIGNGADFFCFVVRNNVQKILGEFDEQFNPAYFEDNDMDYRAKLSGNRTCKLLGLPVLHYGSQTIRNDDKLFTMNRYTYSENQNKFIFKWNGLPGMEKYINPYGIKDKDWRFVQNVPGRNFTKIQLS